MSKKIVIAEDEPITRMDIAEILTEAGYDVVGMASDGFDAVEMCKNLKPDLVLMDIKMPLLDGLKASRVLLEEKIVSCVVILTAYSTREFINEAKSIGIMGYVVKPVNEKNLLPAIEIAIAKDEEINYMKESIEKAKEDLKARKLIEKAKGILMKKGNITEEEAYNMIRKLSMDKRAPMKDIAKAIIMNR
ncbi:ANTAR domain-containing response regulator [Anaerosalibacter massiliensis]|uniref:Response regulator n=1 Tax=Anaerosalibacter massiliensis TaxID=1347392 RepID=A0A9X2MMN0_9FIRM|nr:response regulator [Anaerosalibacter massiliensis]MCR2043821.1 response regulator [Anaerosalibacter massiliensis]